MANGGAFGNPLTTGIALNFEVDMTPYRQMMQDNLKFAQTQAAETQAKEKEFQDILKNITLDTSKIHERYKKNAMSEYASTINDAMAMHKAGDISSMYQRMNKYKADMNSYIASTQDFNNYKNSKGDKTFRNEAAIAAMDNVEGVSNEQLMKDYQNDVGYSNGLFNFTVIDRPDLLGETNKILQGAEKTIVFDGGKPVVMGRMPETDEVIYQESVKDPDKVIDYLSGWLMSSPGGNRLLMDYGGINASQLDERTPDGMQKRAALAREYVSKEIEPKLYGQKISKIPEKEAKGYMGGYGKTDEYSYEFVDQPRAIYGNLPASQTGGRGGQELLVDVDNSMVFQNLGKTAKKFAINIPAGSFEIGSEGTEYTPISSTQKGLNDAIALQSYSDKNGKLWYKVASKAEIEQLDVFEAAYRRSQGVDDIDYTSLSKYAKTYLIPSSSEVDSQFWQGVGVDKEERKRIIKDLKGGTSTTGTGSQSSKSSSSSVSTTSLDIKKMSGMKYSDFKDASNKAWVDETAKKIRSMSNIDDLWKQTGKSGTPNGQSNAELLAGFVESGKTDLLTGTTPPASNGANAPSFR
jgi:hypothetical protein